MMAPSCSHFILMAVENTKDRVRLEVFSVLLHRSIARGRAQEMQGVKQGTFSSLIAGGTHSSENNAALSPLSDSLRFGNKHYKHLQVLSPHWPQGSFYQLCHKPQM